MIRFASRLIAPALVALAAAPSLAQGAPDAEPLAADAAPPAAVSTPSAVAPSDGAADVSFGDPASRPDLWRSVDPENLLVIDTTKGRVLVELAPEFAPGHVTRIKSLARENFYDGTKYHRVIDGFMVQGGDPTATGSGGSDKPDLQREFTTRIALGEETVEIGREVVNPRIISEVDGQALSAYTSVRGGFPVAHFQSLDALMMLADGRAEAFIPHCAGVASMARANEPDSANSQYFLMRAAYPSLNTQYTSWGRIVEGLDVVRAIKVFDPSEGETAPPDLDAVTRMRVAADLADAQRPKAWVLKTEAPEFKAVIETTRAARGPDFSVCDIEIPTHVEAASESLDDSVDDLLGKMRR